MQHIKQDKANVTTVAQPGPGYPRKPPTSANDNDCEGSWSRPFPAGSATIQLTRVSDTKKRPPCRQTSFRSSWSGTLSRVTYVMGVSVAMLGWMYLLWFALLTCVQTIPG